MTGLPSPSTTTSTTSSSAAHARAPARTARSCGASASGGAAERARISSARTAGCLSIADPLASTATVAATRLSPAATSAGRLPTRTPVAGARLRPVALSRKILTGTGLAVRDGSPASRAAEFICRVSIPVGSSAAMLRVMLPVVAPSTAASRLVRRAVPTVDVVAVAAVDIAVAIEIVIVVDRYVVVAAPPAAVAPTSSPRRSHRKANSEGNRHPRRVIPHRWIGDRRIWVDWRTVHHGRIVAGHINDLWIGLLDDDDLFRFHNFCFYLLLFSSFQVA